jgi:hypothetical protein
MCWSGKLPVVFLFESFGKWRHIPEDCNLHSHCCENIKFHTFFLVFSVNKTMQILPRKWHLGCGGAGLRRLPQKSEVICLILSASYSFLNFLNRCRICTYIHLQENSLGKTSSSRHFVLYWNVHYYPQACWHFIKLPKYASIYRRNCIFSRQFTWDLHIKMQSTFRL